MSVLVVPIHYCACAQCGKPIGPGTSVKRMYCIRCGTAYCSVECQHLHWKNHKAFCTLHAHQAYGTEAAALSQRIRVRVKADLKRFSDASSPALGPFLAGLFNVGRGPADMSETHILHLEFDYSPDEVSLSRRLPIRNVSFWRRTDIIAAQSNNQSKKALKYLLGSAYEAAKRSTSRSTRDDFSFCPVLWDVLFDRKDTPPIIMAHNTQCLVVPYPIHHMTCIFPALTVDDALVAALRTAFEQLDLE